MRCFRNWESQIDSGSQVDAGEPIRCELKMRWTVNDAVKEGSVPSRSFMEWSPNKRRKVRRIRFAIRFAIWFANTENSWGFLRRLNDSIKCDQHYAANRSWLMDRTKQVEREQENVLEELGKFQIALNWYAELIHGENKQNDLTIADAISLLFFKDSGSPPNTAVVQTNKWRCTTVFKSLKTTVGWDYHRRLPSETTIGWESDVAIKRSVKRWNFLTIIIGLINFDSLQ